METVILWIMELPKDTPIIGMCLAPIVEPSLIEEYNAWVNHYLK